MTKKRIGPSVPSQKDKRNAPTVWIPLAGSGNIGTPTWENPINAIVRGAWGDRIVAPMKSAKGYDETDTLPILPAIILAALDHNQLYQQHEKNA